MSSRLVIGFAPKDGEADFVNAAVNASLKRFAEELAGIANTFEQLASLVSVLDEPA